MNKKIKTLSTKKYIYINTKSSITRKRVMEMLKNSNISTPTATPTPAISTSLSFSLNIIAMEEGTKCGETDLGKLKGTAPF